MYYKLTKVLNILSSKKFIIHLQIPVNSLSNPVFDKNKLSIISTFSCQFAWHNLGLNISLFFCFTFKFKILFLVKFNSLIYSLKFEYYLNYNNIQIH